jgi:hypothetical protein
LKNENYSIFVLVPYRKNLSQLPKNLLNFNLKIVTKLSEIWVGDPGSGKRLIRDSDLGVKKAPDPVSAFRNSVYVIQVLEPNAQILG